MSVSEETSPFLASVFRCVPTPRWRSRITKRSTGCKERAFLLVITMSEKIYYNRTAAEHFGSAVAAILLTCVVKKCEENNADTIEEVDLQFDLGFSDVEFFSALKTLREKGYIQSRTLRGGARLYVPIPELLDLSGRQ